MTLVASPRPTSDATITTYELGLVVRRAASEPRLWRPLVRAAVEAPQALPGPSGVDVWLRAWPAGTSTGLHARDDAAEAFAVLEGALTEERVDDVLGTWTTLLQAPAVRVLEPGAVHALHTERARSAVTLHARAALGPR